MRLRTRLALVFATTTSLVVASAFGSTFVSFKHAQEHQFDHALMARAELEAEEARLTGGRLLHIEQEPIGSGTELERLVKYGAIYRPDGTLLDSTSTFAGDAPSLQALGIEPGAEPPARLLDFVFRGERLRAVVLKLNRPDRDAALLLLAAPRGDLEADTTHLLEAMLAVLVASTILSTLLGWFLGVRMSRGIEALAGVARRVSKGELSARSKIAPDADEEVIELGNDLNQMIARTSELLTSERRFVSNAAHELRSPLTALRGELELALRRPRSVEEYKNAIQESLDSTERLVVLAEDLLALARAGTQNAFRNQPEEAPLIRIVEEAMRVSLGRAEHPRKVVLRIPDDLRVTARRAELVRILRNLIDNAVAHAPQDTEVFVSAQAGSDGSLELSVDDYGKGVSDDVRNKIFEPFVRGEAERERSGAGLGLAIAREIARSHGGELLLAAGNNPTRFTLRLGPGTARRE